MIAADCLNFTEAASKLFITQPAFSRKISSLEDELGFPLFYRNNKQKSIRLSPAGAFLYEELRKLKADFNKIISKAEQINRGEEGKLTVGILDGYMIDEKVKEVIDQFSEIHKGVEVELISCEFDELIKRLFSGELDVSITMELEIKNIPNIICEDLYTVDSYMVVPKKYNLDVEKTYSIKDFKDKTFILSEDTKGITSLLYDVCRESGFEPKIINAPNFKTKMLWIETGRGIAGNGKEYASYNSPYVNYVKIKEFKPVKFVAAWNKENYNPAIALFHYSYMQINGI